MRTAGVVLCGGRSLRMGQAKAWLPFGGEVMLARVVRLLREVVAPIVVVAAPDQEVPALEDVAIVRDPCEGLGPLQGLAAGLAALRGVADVAFFSACDVPLLEPAFVRRMLALLGDAWICVPEVERLHPLSAVYRVEVGAVAERMLERGERRLMALFEEVPTRVVHLEEVVDVVGDSLRNLNTPEDYDAAIRKHVGDGRSPQSL